VLTYLKAQVDDFLGIFDRRLQHRSFVVCEHLTVVDLSMTGYLVFPKAESGYDLAVSHPEIST